MGVMFDTSVLQDREIQKMRLVIFCIHHIRVQYEYETESIQSIMLSVVYYSLPGQTLRCFRCSGKNKALE